MAPLREALAAGGSPGSGKTVRAAVPKIGPSKWSADFLTEKRKTSGRFIRVATGCEGGADAGAVSVESAFIRQNGQRWGEAFQPWPPARASGP